MFKKIAALAGALLLSTSAVQAADYKVEFTLSGFGAVAPGMETAPLVVTMDTDVRSVKSEKTTLCNARTSAHSG